MVKTKTIARLRSTGAIIGVSYNHGKAPSDTDDDDSDEENIPGPVKEEEDEEEEEEEEDEPEPEEDPPLEPELREQGLEANGFEEEVDPPQQPAPWLGVAAIEQPLQDGAEEQPRQPPPLELQAMMPEPPQAGGPLVATIPEYTPTIHRVYIRNQVRKTIHEMRPRPLHPQNQQPSSRMFSFFLFSPFTARVTINHKRMAKRECTLSPTRASP